MKTEEDLYKYLATWHYFHFQVWEYCNGKNEVGKCLEDMEEQPVSEILIQVKNGVGRVQDEVASYPAVEKILIPWMIDVCGNSSEANEDSMKQALDDLNLKDFIDKCGSLASTVQNVVKSWGFKITDSGGGCCGWHIGIPCNEKDANQLCDLLHNYFKYSIEKGYLTVYKHFWKFRLPGLYNWNEVEIWVDKNGIDIELYNKLIDQYEVDLEKID